MTAKYKRFLIGFSVLTALAGFVTVVGYHFGSKPYHDVIFETNTLLVLLFIFFVSRHVTSRNPYMKSGIMLLLLNQIYDIAEEFPSIGRWADQHELTHTLIEDGTLQMAYLLIAFGITRLVRRMRRNALTDELTGLYNRKALFSITRCQFDLIYIDLDGLKEVNDTHGHASGDLTIIRFAHAIRACLQPSDDAFRIGGDEFVIVVGHNEGAQFIDRLKLELGEETILFSFGIEASTPNTLKENLIKTDRAMYAMKHRQRQKSSDTSKASN
ncbi:GGDEF domain-containing protein [Vibrio ostreicida]|uniref:diguanylate cyclase n=2 Tax=Vibrio ostreicida TaxID=526588 RepID=A0ABT8BTH7_9VIBR|nr:GGDEF domain-containing protein [Vibrio ostreicida]MDN3609973.1 GGDEF domain-containing protein [Vibrio ostreicida]NPD10398.1 GGDEF domain-containing protein [Vibrio ostreicida]